MRSNKTVSYVAKPRDSRCAWWSLILPDSLELSSSKIPAPYLKKGADLELTPGTMLIDSEARHHRKNRGYEVHLGVVFPTHIGWIQPTLARKQYIKEHDGQDLMHESGDVAGAVRRAVWLRRQPNLKSSF